MKHKAGFVNILGRPNVGKSTLMNALVGERLSIISPKAQTTRHRIVGIVNDDEHQIVFNDTPGFIEKTAYKLHETMNSFVKEALDDGDILVFLTDKYQTYDIQKDILLAALKQAEDKLIVAINKTDLYKINEVAQLETFWKEIFPKATLLFISATQNGNTEVLLQEIKKRLPLHPPYYDKDALTDRPERFFTTEIIREKIFLQYEKEIPYSCEVAIEEYKELEKLDIIRAIIYVERETQKMILLGKGGSSIKKLGIEARESIELFLQKKVHLDLFVKVKENWRSNETTLKNFGYK